MRPHGLYVSRRLFEAVFGPWRRSEGNVQHSGAHVDAEAAYEGWDRRGGRYGSPQGRIRRTEGKRED